MSQNGRALRPFRRELNERLRLLVLHNTTDWAVSWRQLSWLTAPFTNFYFNLILWFLAVCIFWNLLVVPRFSAKSLDSLLHEPFFPFYSRICLNVSFEHPLQPSCGNPSYHQHLPTGWVNIWLLEGVYNMGHLGQCKVWIGYFLKKQEQRKPQLRKRPLVTPIWELLPLLQSRMGIKSQRTSVRPECQATCRGYHMTVAGVGARVSEGETCLMFFRVVVEKAISKSTA